ncbi:molybdopterin-binding protein [Brevibacterium marinum]|uniref:Molybdopterin molybdenumtransferase n=1 Tax=Brevibacterium marinum TaxID=418643 RepID=A0A846S7D5_9MICO|nr:molybdopterin molybdotransferase [Brevibacterium marinum]
MEPEEYCDRLIASIPNRTVETVPVAAALGRTAAEDVIAETPIPAFATSAMDGFALDESALHRARDGAEVVVSGDIPAGSVPMATTPGTAVRVMTGAQVPTSAEVVVPVEITDAPRTGPAPNRILVSSLPSPQRPGWNIRAVGEDTREGEAVIFAGDTIGPAGVGTLAMLGLASVRVERALTIGLIVTGDELSCDPTGTDDRIGLSGPDRLGEPEQPFVHNSNLPMLGSAIANLGAVPVERSCGDDPGAFLTILKELQGQVDLIITTGGISAGAFEVVRQALEGEHSTFLRLAQRPGGPQGHGRFGTTALLHFPGTPTGALLSFHLFGRSLIEARPLRARWRTAVFAGDEVIGHEKAMSLVPGRFTADGDVEAATRSRLRDFAGADVIIRLPRHPQVIRRGDAIAVLDCR